VHLLDVEFMQVLRRLVREGTLTPKRAGEAIEDLAALRITRYAPVLLLQRIWRLRQNLSAYDAAYVALAENLQAPLITRDQRIAAAPGHTAIIEVFREPAGNRCRSLRLFPNRPRDFSYARWVTSISLSRSTRHLAAPPALRNSVSST
jgi:predicted nucleic acid-binding protein